MLAGAYIGFAIILVFSIEAPLVAAGSPAVMAVMGASFGIALALVIFAGSELFTAKLGMIFWCLFAFIGAGFEHSVANMTLLGMALFGLHDGRMSWSGLPHNPVPVTIGNIGGAVVVGAAYYFVSLGQQRLEATESARLDSADVRA